MLLKRTFWFFVHLQHSFISNWECYTDIGWCTIKSDKSKLGTQGRTMSVSMNKIKTQEETFKIKVNTFLPFFFILLLSQSAYCMLQYAEISVAVCNCSNLNALLSVLSLRYSPWDMNVCKLQYVTRRGNFSILHLSNAYSDTLNLFLTF